MVRILHTADWHRGAPSAHPVYQKLAIPKLVKLAIVEDCKYVLVVGDVFDKPNPDQRVKDRLIRQLAPYVTKDITFIFVVGNHDYTTKDKQYHSLHYLRVLKLLTDSLALGKLNIHVMEPGQYASFPDFRLYVMDEFTEPDVKFSTDRPGVLAWHGTVPGLDYAHLSKHSKQAITKIASIRSAANAAYIALGDIHRCMRVAPYCWYAGPPTQKSYVDEDGVLVVSIDGESTKVKKCRLDLPKKINITVTFEEGTDTEKSVVEFVKEKFPAGNLIKLKFELPLSVWSSLDRVYINKALKKHCLELVLENDPVTEHRSRKAIKNIAKAASLTDELSIILEEEDFGLDKKKLEEKCREYL